MYFVSFSLFLYMPTLYWQDYVQDIFHRLTFPPAYRSLSITCTRSTEQQENSAKRYRDATAKQMILPAVGLHCLVMQAWTWMLKKIPEASQAGWGSTGRSSQCAGHHYHQVACTWSCWPHNVLLVFSPSCTKGMSALKIHIFWSCN